VEGVARLKVLSLRVAHVSYDPFVSKSRVEISRLQGYKPSIAVPSSAPMTCDDLGDDIGPSNAKIRSCVESRRSPGTKEMMTVPGG
jgi:hypothetical protein